MEIPNRLDLYEIGRQYVLSRAERIDPTKVDVAGSDINLFVGSQSFVAHAVMQQLIFRINAQLLDGCDTDEDIDRFAWNNYQELRKGAAAAVVLLTITRPTTVAGSGTVPAGWKFTSLTGIEYVSTAPAAFGPTDTEVSGVFARAALAGKEYQVGLNAIRRIDSVDQLWDKTLEVTNPEAAAGGEPAEVIDDFRERIRAFWLAARRGTLPAIEYGARSVPGVISAYATEEIDYNGQPARSVRLAISDSSGVASSALGLLVKDVLREWRAGGIPVIIDLSIPQYVELTLKLTFLVGTSTTILRENVRAAVVAFVNSLGVGRALYYNDVAAVLSRFRAQGLVPEKSSIVEPVGDVVPEAGRSLRTTTERVSFVP